MTDQSHTPLPCPFCGEQPTIHEPGMSDADAIKAWNTRSVNSLPSLVKALEEIGREVYTDGTPTKAARTASAALSAYHGEWK